MFLEAKSRLLKVLLLSLSTFFLTACSNISNVEPEKVKEQVTVNSFYQHENNQLQSESENDDDTSESNMTVHFIDIGQGDCTLIECDGENMLIDAGENDKGSAVQLYLTKHNISNLKYFIITHPDSDHEGGADVIITKFNIENLFMCDYPKSTRTHEDVIYAANAKALNWRIPRVGETYNLGGASFTIIAPNKSYDDSNNSSIAILLVNGDNKFIFTGDCEQEAERDILNNGIDIDADVLQVGHHGSNSSSTQDFLNSVTPAYAVISCSVDNPYGHPRAETLNKFQTMGIQMFRTDDQGTVIAYSDGTNITWNMPPSDNWTPGEPQINSQTSSDTSSMNVTNEEASNTVTYVLNKNTHKFHYPNCASAKKIAQKNYAETTKTRDEIIAEGFSPCGNCRP